MKKTIPVLIVFTLFSTTLASCGPATDETAIPAVMAEPSPTAVATAEIEKDSSSQYKLGNTKQYRLGDNVLTDASVSPDGKFLALASDHRIRIFKIPTLELVRELPYAHAFHVAWSPGSTYLASSGDNDVILVWEASSDSILELTDPESEGIFSMQWSPSGAFLATGGRTGLTHVWDIGTGEQTLSLEGVRHWVYGIAWSPDESLIATVPVKWEDWVTLWDASTGEQVGLLEGHQAPIADVEFSPDGTLLASASNDHDIILWDIATLSPVDTLEGHMDVVRKIAFSPDGKFLASNGYDNSLIIWDLATGEIKKSYDDSRAMAWSADGTLAYAEGIFIDIWGKENPNGSGIGVGPETVPVLFIDWMPDNQNILIVKKDGVTYSLNFFSDQDLIATTQLGDGTISSFSWSPDGSQLAVNHSGSRAVHIWDLSTQTRKNMYMFPDFPMKEIYWSPAEDVIASYVYRWGLLFWDPNNGKPIYDLMDSNNDPEKRFYNFAWSPDGKYFATVQSDRVRIWETSTLERHNTPENNIFSDISDIYAYRILDLSSDDPEEYISFVRWSSQAQTIAGASNLGSVLVWDVPADEIIFELRNPPWDVSTIEWSPDGALIAIATKDGSVMIYDPFDGSQARAFKGLFQETTFLSWSPTNDQIAVYGIPKYDPNTAEGDRFKLIRLETGFATGEVQPFPENTTAMSWSPDGKYLVAGNLYGDIYVLEFP